jgi:hypothetical protein
MSADVASLARRFDAIGYLDSRTRRRAPAHVATLIRRVRATVPDDLESALAGQHVAEAGPDVEPSVHAEALLAALRWVARFDPVHAHAALRPLDRRLDRLARAAGVSPFTDEAREALRCVFVDAAFQRFADNADPAVEWESVMAVHVALATEGLASGGEHAAEAASAIAAHALDVPNVADALHHAELAVRWSAVLERRDPDRLRHLYVLASSAHMAGAHDRVLELAGDLVTGLDDTLGPDDPCSIDLRLTVADSASALGDHIRATSLAADAVWICESELGPEHPLSLASYGVLARLLRRADRPSEAVAVSRQHLERSRHLLDSSPREVAHAGIGLAAGYLQSAEYEAASAIARETLAWCSPRLGPGDDLTETLRRIVGDHS